MTEKNKRNKRPQEVIDREKAKLKAELENISEIDVLNTETTPTEREYSRKFKSLFYGIRKALVIISKKRTAKLYTNQEAYNKAITILNAFCVDVEEDEE